MARLAARRGAARRAGNVLLEGGEKRLVSNVEGAWKLAKARHEIPLFSRTGIDRGYPYTYAGWWRGCVCANVCRRVRLG